MAADPQDAASAREVAELKREVSTLQDRITELQQRPAVTPGVIEALGLDTPMGRRQAMVAGVFGGGAAAGMLTAATEPARADAAPADVGTSADPWREVFTHKITSGDGQTHIDAGSDIFPATASTEQLGDSSNPWAAVFTDAIDIGTADFVDTGDNFGLFAVYDDSTYSTSSNSYGNTGFADKLQYDKVAPANATVEWVMVFNTANTGDQISVRLRNTNDGETVLETTETTDGDKIVSGTYTPTTTGSVVNLNLQIKNDDNSTSVSVTDPVVYATVQT